MSLCAIPNVWNVTFSQLFAGQVKRLLRSGLVVLLQTEGLTVFQCDIIVYKSCRIFKVLMQKYELCSNLYFAEVLVLLPWHCLIVMMDGEDYRIHGWLTLLWTLIAATYSKNDWLTLRIQRVQDTLFLLDIPELLFFFSWLQLKSGYHCKKSK